MSTHVPYSLYYWQWEFTNPRRTTEADPMASPYMWDDTQHSCLCMRMGHCVGLGMWVMMMDGYTVRCQTVGKKSVDAIKSVSCYKLSWMRMRGCQIRSNYCILKWMCVPRERSNVLWFIIPRLTCVSPFLRMFKVHIKTVWDTKSPPPAFGVSAIRLPVSSE